MKILISAAACDPFGGSEGGIGWGWVTTVALNHEVYCLTSGKYRAAWQKALVEGLVPDTLHVRFLGSEKRWSKNRTIARIQSWLRFLTFNRNALTAAEEWHREVSFDLAHHVTYATWRVPSSLWKLPVPFVWGPIGGFSIIPRPFRGMLGNSAKILEIFRDLQTWKTLRSKKFRNCVIESAHIFAANHETLESLTVWRKGRPMTGLPSAFLQRDKIERFTPCLEKKITTSQPLRLFAGGNIEGRKGVDLALRALRRVKDEGIDFRYEVAGGGPDVKRLRRLTETLDLGANVTFSSGYAGDAYLEKLRESDIYFLPSFRETTPVTLLEAILSGCYPIVVNASAAGEIVKFCGGDAIEITSPEQVITDLAEAIMTFRSSREKNEIRWGDLRSNLIKMFSQDRFINESNRVYNALWPKTGLVR